MGWPREGAEEVGWLAPPCDQAISLATVGIIATGHSARYGILVIGYTVYIINVKRNLSCLVGSQSHDWVGGHRMARIK